MNRIICILLFLGFTAPLKASYLLLPMDAESQRDHLKAYGITYWVLENQVESWWLLNYRGGSFAFPYNKAFEKECLTRGVSYEVISDGALNSKSIKSLFTTLEPVKSKVLALIFFALFNALNTFLL